MNHRIKEERAAASASYELLLQDERLYRPTLVVTSVHSLFYGLVGLQHKDVQSLQRKIIRLQAQIAKNTHHAIRRKMVRFGEVTRSKAAPK